jgi:hypothetical protein
MGVVITAGVLLVGCWIGGGQMFSPAAKAGVIIAFAVVGESIMIL